MKPMTLALTELDDRTATFSGSFIQGNGNIRAYGVTVSLGGWIEVGRPTQVTVTLEWPE